MKLASLKNKRDGKLIVVNRELTQYVSAEDIAPTLQAALDDWQQAAPKLQTLFEQLQAGEIKGIPFNEKECASPLPRAYHWADGSAYVNHIELVRKARGAEMPESFWTDPLIYQGGADTFLAPYENIKVPSEEYGIDYEAEIAVITDDVPMSVSVEAAEKHIQLLMLVNDVSLRNLIPAELAKGFGFYQSKPSSAFSPVAVTPDELGAAWKDGKVHLPLRSSYNGKKIGSPNAGVDMTFNFPTLVAHAAKTRELGTGTIIGSGTVSNRDRSTGSSCFAEIRMLEIIEEGKASTDFMKFGDTIKIEMLDDKGQSIFGTIEQQVEKT